MAPTAPSWGFSGVPSAISKPSGWLSAWKTRDPSASGAVVPRTHVTRGGPWHYPLLPAAEETMKDSVWCTSTGIATRQMIEMSFAAWEGTGEYDLLDAKALHCSILETRLVA